jgi:Right handed beta helix region
MAMGLRTAVLTGFVALVVAAPAQAATFTVNTTADTAGAAGCPTDCTVRNAISAAAANGNTTDDVVVIPAGTYVLNTQLGSLAVPASATRITITGAGANTTFLQSAASSGMRVLSVGSSAGVTLTDLTLRNGSVATGTGGNLLISSAASVTLSRARVTGGTAPRGGGIATSGAAALTISRSLIDTNLASGTSNADLGGGLYVEGQTTATAVTIQDSTFTANRAWQGGGIGVVNNTGQSPILRGVTLARNTARGNPGIAGIYSLNTTARIQGSILAGNTYNAVVGSGTIPVTTNCGLASAAIDEGGNLESAADCGLAGHQNTDPLLAAALDTSQPPVLAIPATSPAVNIAACGARTSDQRGMTRPQGPACDAGAYEVDLTPPVITIAAGPTDGTSPTFSFTSEAGATFQCSLDGEAFAGCVSPYTTRPLAAGPHTFSVRAIDTAGNIGAPATRAFTTAPPPIVTLPQQPTPTPVATPIAGESVGMRPLGGKVLVKLPGSSRFVPLSPSVIKNGAEVDTRNGVVEITRSDGGVAKFYEGIFKLSQSGGITTLTLTEKLTGCPSKKKQASAAAKKPKTRKLWGDGQGKFRTRGQYSAATIRGTKWLVQDTCATTVTRVVRGVVAVNDFVKKKTLLVKQGKRYTARPKR